MRFGAPLFCRGCALTHGTGAFPKPVRFSLCSNPPWKSPKTSGLTRCWPTRSRASARTWTPTVRWKARCPAGARARLPRGPLSSRQGSFPKRASWVSLIRESLPCPKVRFPASTTHPSIHCRPWAGSTPRWRTRVSRSSRRPTRSTWRRLPWLRLCPWSTGSEPGSWCRGCRTTAVSQPVYANFRALITEHTHQTGN